MGRGAVPEPARHAPPTRRRGRTRAHLDRHPRGRSGGRRRAGAVARPALRPRPARAARGLSDGAWRRFGSVTTTAEPLDQDLFLPEPEPRQVKYTIISVDDHLVEP